MEPTPWGTDVVRLRREDVDRSYQLWVATTPHAVPAPGRDGRPLERILLLCLDAPWTFGTVVDAARIIGLGKGVPPAVVAGLAHDEPSPRELLNLRAADFTVSQAEAPPMTGVRLRASEVGGAEPFRAWLESDVLPLLAERYPHTERVFVGHSFTALFGLHVLFGAPDMFDKYLLASPSVWWDSQIMFRTEAAHFAANPVLHKQVFMSRGVLETDEWSPHEAFWRQMDSRGYEGLNLTWCEFEGEDHLSVVSVALNRGLRELIGNGQVVGSVTSESGTSQPATGPPYADETGRP